jgi:hypothetical protein
MSEKDKEEFKENWYSSFPIELDELMNYIEPVINFRKIIDGQSTYIAEHLRRCTVEDFESRGYKFKNEIDKKFVTYRFCPPMELMEYLMLKNDYSNSDLRMSFSLELYLCDREKRSTCKSNK